MSKAKRRRPARYNLVVQYDSKRGRWILKARGTSVGFGQTRAVALKRARKLCRGLWKKGTPAQLKVRNKSDGRWSLENSYGCDSPRRKG